MQISRLLIAIAVLANYIMISEIKAFDNPIKLKVAILVYDEVYLLDFAGPLEVFYDTELENGEKGFEVFLVAPEKRCVKTHTGSLFQPDYDIHDCPQPDILVIPGGNLNLAQELPQVSGFIRNASEKAQIVMSVCTGAFILAELGMLDGLQATTWHGAKRNLQKKYPKVILSDKRFTDNGKIITTAGISAGIDGSFYVVKRIFGENIMQKTLKYIEWNNAE